MVGAGQLRGASGHFDWLASRHRCGTRHREGRFGAPELYLAPIVGSQALQGALRIYVE